MASRVVSEISRLAKIGFVGALEVSPLGVSYDPIRIHEASFHIASFLLCADGSSPPRESKRPQCETHRWRLLVATWAYHTEPQGAWFNPIRLDSYCRVAPIVPVTAANTEIAR